MVINLFSLLINLESYLLACFFDLSNKAVTKYDIVGYIYVINPTIRKFRRLSILLIFFAKLHILIRYLTLFLIQ